MTVELKHIRIVAISKRLMCFLFGFCDEKIVDFYRGKEEECELIQELVDFEDFLSKVNH